VDNLTHGFVGVLLAENVVRLVERREPPHGRFRAEIYALAVVGNNLPDLDFIYQNVSGPRFGYLLQHRGFTHTLVAVFGFALLQLAMVVWRRRANGVALARPEAMALGLVALAGPLLHVGMDFTNNYGVHPFWPLDNRWFYGDTLFIVEPALWIALLAPQAFTMESKAGRWMLWLALAVATGALWYRPLLPTREAIFLTAIAAVLVVAGRSLSALGRCWLANAATALLILGFALAGRSSKALALEAASERFPAARSLEVVATPMPANPFCWQVMWMGIDGTDYVLLAGVTAVVPAWLDVTTCVYDDHAHPSMPLASVLPGTAERVSFRGVYRHPLRDLQALAKDRCEFAALTRFARAPYVTETAADGSRIAGDARYDRAPGLDFADVPLGREPGDCPPYVPPWQPPRTDALTAVVMVPPTPPPPVVDAGPPSPPRRTLAAVLAGDYDGLTISRLEHPSRIQGDYQMATGESTVGSGPFCETYFHFTTPLSDADHVAIEARLDPKKPKETVKGELWVVDERTLRIRLDEIYGMACAPPEITGNGASFSR